MKNMTGNNKKITAAALALILGIAAVFGIASAVRATTSSTVLVVRASDLNYGQYLDWQNSVSGMITTEAEQNIYLTDTEVVEEVMVKEGQAVHKGDVLMRFDTTGTKLNLEKEKINQEKLKLQIEVAEENLTRLNAKSPISEGGDYGFPDDFGGFDAEEEMKKADVHEKELKADAKPANDDPEDMELGTEYNPYIFLCKGDSITITKDFIKKWQKYAKKNKMKQLYIALEVRDKKLNLQKSWITDVMLLDPKYSIDVDLTTGKTTYSALNKPEEMAALLRKILKDVPEDERGQWLAVMLDKLMITTEKEEKLKERGQLLADMINQLGAEDQEELSAAALLLDEETLAILFRSLSESLTEEKLEAVDEEATAALLTALLTNMSQEQVQAIDAQILADFISKMSDEQINALGTDLLGSIIVKLDEDQLKVVMQRILDERGGELTEMLQNYLDTHSGDDPGDGSGDGQETGGGGNQGTGGDNNQGTGGDDNQGTGGDNNQGTGGDDNQGTGGDNNQGTGGDNNQGTGGDNNQGTGGDDQGSNNQQSGGDSSGDSAGSQDPGSQNGNEAGTSGASSEETAPSTSPSPSDDGGSGSSGSLISYDMEYTSEELAEAKKEAKNELRDLQLDLRESQLKIDKAQSAVDEGVVTANMNGVITAVGDPESPPSDGSAFLTLSGSEGLFVKSGIKESKLGTIKEGDMVIVTSWQTGGQYEAEIKSISPYPDSTGMFDDNSETYYPFTANILDAGAEVSSGEWVEVSYTSDSQGESSGDTMTIIKAFVREDGNRKYVYKRGEDNKLVKQYIETGSLSDSGYEVLSGLTESDWVAFPYGKNVKEGARTREGSVGELYE